MKKEFISVFQMSKTITFEVEYYTLSTNKTAHFSTSANEFARNKRDYTRCGQAQNDLLKPFRRAMQFFKKWDIKHLQDLTQQEYDELMQDIEILKQHYNFIFRELDETKRPYSPCISFYETAEFTKQTPKQMKKEGARG